MSDSADIGHGYLFKRGDDVNPQGFATIPGLIEPALPTLAREIKDATDTESPDRYREKMSGLFDAGDLPLTFELVEGSASQALLYTDLHSRVKRAYKIVANNNAQTTWSFNGLISSIAPSIPLDDKKTIAVTIAISGKPVIT